MFLQRPVNAESNQQVFYGSDCPTRLAFCLASGKEGKAGIAMHRKPRILLQLVALFSLLVLCAGSVHAQNVLTNGGNHDGTVLQFETNSWTFTADAGDTVVFRTGRLTQSGGFHPWMRIHNHNATLIADSDGASTATARELEITLTNSGTYTVLVSDGSSSGYNGSGTYRLRYFNLSEPWIVADDGGALANGGNHDGSIEIGDLDAWSFTAAVGDRLVLRSASFNGNNTNYRLWLRIYDSNGNLFADYGSGNAVTVTDWVLAITNNGSYTLLVGDTAGGDMDDFGDYRLHYFNLTEAWTVADEGGPLDNGGNHDGTILIGDLDAWTFAADVGNTVVLRVARLSSTNGFETWLRLYDSTGTLVVEGTGSSPAVRELAFVPTNSATFTLLVGDSAFPTLNGTGTYQCRLAKFPGAFVVPEGDEGGAMTNAFQHVGTNDLGDLDVWSFQVCRVSFVSLTCEELTDGGSFAPHLRLYGADGALVATAQNNSLAAINFQPANSGRFTLLVDDGNLNSTGTYRLTGSGLVEGGLRFCPLLVSGGILDVAATGGSPGSNGVLYASTNLSPTVVWSPLWTNQFGQDGLFQYTNTFNPNDPQHYFLLEQQ